jgi:DNA-binding MurR/RpiR family transcriptional regulator
VKGESDFDMILIKYQCLACIKLVVTPRKPMAFRRNLRISARIAMLGLVGILYLGLFNALDDAALDKMESLLQLYGQVDELSTNPAREPAL